VFWRDIIQAERIPSQVKSWELPMFLTCGVLVHQDEDVIVVSVSHSLDNMDGLPELSCDTYTIPTGAVVKVQELQPIAGGE
jgi:hypothetical protein